MTDPAPDEEVVDALPVLAERAPGPEDLEAALAPRSTPGALVVTAERQAAVVAAASFVAGAATVAVLRRRRGRRGALPGRRRNGRKGELVRVTGSRSFLVDVHLLERG